MDDPAEPPVSNRQPPAAGDGTWVPIPVTVGKATTYIDRPLRPDGYLDYLEAARRLGRAGVTAETNAAVLIFLAIGSSHIDAEFREEYFRRLDMPTPPADGDYFVDMKEFAASRDIDIGYDEDRALIATTYDREWTREDSSLVADWLAANESPLSLFAEASRRSHFHLPLVAKETDNALDQVVPPPFTPIRGAVRALRQRAMLHVGEGRLRDAEADLLTIHRLADLLRQGTTWTTSLVGTAFQGIACEGDVVLAYFGQELPAIGLSVALLAGIAIPIVVGGSAPLGRYLALDARRLYGGPLGLTALAMTVGGFTTLTLALVVEGVPTFSARAWLLIIWLAAINAALTYTLWTQAQRTLRAVEASVLADLTVILIAVVGWLVLEETLAPIQIGGLVLAVAGVFLVQLAPMLRGKRSTADPTPAP